MYGHNDGYGGLALSRLCIWIEVSGGEDANVLGVKDGFRKAWEKVFRAFRQEGNREGVDGKLDLIGGEAEGQPGRVAHGEGLVELAGECVEIGREGRRRGGTVGDE